MLPNNPPSLFPPDILQPILDNLQHSGHLQTLASFQQTSKANYTLTGPYLYKEISISENHLVELLHTFCILEGQYKSKLVDQITVSALRYITLRDAFKQYQKIILKESQYQKSISKAAAFQARMDRVQRSFPHQHPFPNLQSLGLLIYRQTGSAFEKVLKHIIVPICRPQTICIRWSNISESSDILDLLASNYNFLIDNNEFDLIIHQADESVTFSGNCLPRTLRISYHPHYPPDATPLLYVVVRSMRSAAVEIGADSHKSSSWRIIVPETSEEDFEITAKALIQHCLQVQSGELTAYDMDQSFDLERTLKWCEEAIWVNKDEQEDEPACEVCGSEL